MGQPPLLTLQMTLSLRFCPCCPSSQSADSSVSPGSGTTSSPNTARSCPRPSPAFSTPRTIFNAYDGSIAFPTFDGISGDQKQLFPDSSLPFLTGYKQILPNDCCNGLIFCICWKDSPIGEADYVVCNPATEELVVLPDAGYESGALAYRLGSDAALSPHFHVFQILGGDEDYGYISGVSIYSSKTGAWSYKENGWGDNEIQ